MVLSLVLVLMATLVGTLGQTMLKIGMNRVGRIGMAELQNPVQFLVMVFTNPYIVIAVPLYFGGFLIWLVVLSRLRLSFAYPLLALNYVFIPLVGMLVLGEPIEIRQWLGMAIICVGVFLVVTGTNTP